MRRLRLTEGERSVAMAYIGIGLFGAGLAFNVVNGLGGSDNILRPLTPYDFWMIASGALGADLGLYLSRNRFGHPGAAGAAMALLGALLLTFSATIIAGTLALPGYGTMFGLLAVGVSFWSSPFLALVWTIMLAACHLLFAIWRRERDTLFVILDDGIPV